MIKKSGFKKDKKSGNTQKSDKSKSTKDNKKGLILDSEET